MLEMKEKLGITVIICAFVAGWSFDIFLNTIDGDMLWKKIASGAGFLFFGTMLILTFRKLMKHPKQSA